MCIHSLTRTVTVRCPILLSTNVCLILSVLDDYAEIICQLSELAFNTLTVVTEQLNAVFV